MEITEANFSSDNIMNVELPYEGVKMNGPVDQPSVNQRVLFILEVLQKQLMESNP